ncbi:MBL fold metallo-hydrolase [Alkalibacter rhizosphaerae]|uniref:MBL fold metallo-hydrolase n=1 Tax=Alkalibacter rhizosphaerae TaxID=2815577 RepID=A0A975AGD7_9FIRM|nr:MBL fold metallo-hydrolase [Alkalibacter rhizosphaerae]QSX07429.1 MBL fold metallo-hydrolase [Alkalibacter rhizosphaerae]
MYIQHIGHSGFLVSHKKFVLLFDCIDSLDLSAIQDKEIIFFASHQHKDHYNKDLAEELSAFHTTYILSNDIEAPIPQQDLTCLMAPYQEVTLGPLHVRTFSSTDRGVSFYVELQGKRYFHSGDLNWWHWSRMNDTELAKEEADFKAEIEKIKGLPIDFAFVPVDPRLKEHGLLAANHFAKILGPTYLIPMHSFGEYEYYENLESRLDLGRTKLIPATISGQKIWEEQD